MSDVTTPLPQYRCHKVVGALKIAMIERGMGDQDDHIFPQDEGYAPFWVEADYVKKHSPVAGGYYVVYEDGYKSFSPAAAFEAGYTRI